MGNTSKESGAAGPGHGRMCLLFTQQCRRNPALKGCCVDKANSAEHRPALPAGPTEIFCFLHLGRGVWMRVSLRKVEITLEVQHAW